MAKTKRWELNPSFDSEKIYVEWTYGSATGRLELEPAYDMAQAFLKAGYLGQVSAQLLETSGTDMPALLASHGIQCLPEGFELCRHRGSIGVKLSEKLFGSRAHVTPESAITQGLMMLECVHAGVSDAFLYQFLMGQKMNRTVLQQNMENFGIHRENFTPKINL